MGSELQHVPAAPAVVETRPTPPRPRTDDWALVIGPIAQLAEQVSDTEFVPAALRGKPAAVTAAVLFGRELDMPPMQALQQVHVIDGRPSLSAEHMRAMVLAAGHILRVTGDGGSAVATGRRLLPNGEYGEPVTVEWNIRMAQAAGLTGKKNWQRHPRQMLKARATAELCRDLFADITHGVVATEEVEDETGGTPARDDAPKAKVSRARKVQDSGQASGPAPLPPPGDVPTPDAAPPASAAPAPPLPGEEAPAESTPGEGPANQAAPAGAPDWADSAQASVADQAYLDALDPPPISEGDGSPDDLAATATDEVWEAAQEASGGPVEENDPPISKGAQRALFAAFGALGVKDDAERYHTTSALLGRKIDSWNELTRSDGERMFKAIEGIKTRDELENLIQRAAEEWGSSS